MPLTNNRKIIVAARTGGDGSRMLSQNELEGKEQARIVATTAARLAV